MGLVRDAMSETRKRTEALAELMQGNVDASELVLLLLKWNVGFWLLSHTQKQEIGKRRRSVVHVRKT
jgi:hypothetical protein